MCFLVLKHKLISSFFKFKIKMFKSSDIQFESLKRTLEALNYKEVNFLI